MSSFDFQRNSYPQLSYLKFMLWNLRGSKQEGFCINQFKLPLKKCQFLFLAYEYVPSKLIFLLETTTNTGLKKKKVLFLFYKNARDVLRSQNKWKQ